jgi:hypothetical protein
VDSTLTMLEFSAPGGSQKPENGGQFLASKIGPVFGPKVGSLMNFNKAPKRGPVLDSKNGPFFGPHFGIHFWPKGQIFAPHVGVHLWPHRGVFPECDK